jgi:hypothetical protein
MIAPNIAVELVTFEAERHLGQLETLVRADLNRGAQWDQELKPAEQQ